MTDKCSYPNCRNPQRQKTRALCQSHNNQFIRGEKLHPIRLYGLGPKPPRAPTVIDIPVFVACALSMCDSRTGKTGYCSPHDGIARNYGIHPSELEAIYAGGCQICGTTKGLVVDHDHRCCDRATSCGKCVRGALCFGCNNSVGRWERNEERFDAIYAYVKASYCLADLEPHPRARN